MQMIRTASLVARAAVDFALPPRCPSCGIITGQVHQFCADCWPSLTFLSTGGCETCGLPLEATEASTCGACLARPPRIARTRSAVAYDDLSRSLAIKLKYGRKIALATTMARFMAPHLRDCDPQSLLVPVPLHRLRTWSRGFNQAALLARALSTQTGLDVDPMGLRRIKRTPPLKGMTPAQRRRTVAGAFAMGSMLNPVGRTVVLVDDVLTSGSTADACASVLLRNGAGRVELLTWARVLGPKAHH